MSNCLTPLQEMGLLDNCKYIAFSHDQQVIALDLDLCTSVLPIKNSIANFYRNGFIFFAWTGSYNGTTLRFFFSSIRNNNTTSSLFFSSCRLNNYPVVQRGNIDLFSHNCI